MEPLSPSHLLEIRPEDLLQREAPPVISDETRSLIDGKRVVVTGAAGSIGSELVRQVLRLSPSAVFRLDTDESRLHALQLELTGSGFNAADDVVLGDVRDTKNIYRLFDELRPDVVFHAAALKHLNMLERFPCQGIKTNVLGTNNVLDAALQSNASHFVNISTDKAADPSSVLGSSKRLAEVIVRSNSVGTISAGSVRFGNVLGSRGSLFHTLIHQLRARQPLTITHPDATRFFMTIPEAVGLVLEASSLAQHGETFVLDMGEPVRILDVATKLSKLANLAMPEIVVTGLHPGEKLHETLFAPAEVRCSTRHNRIWSTAGDHIPADFAFRLGALYEAAMEDNDAVARERLHNVMSPINSALTETHH